MHLTGADAVITERVRRGASAAAVVARPTLRHFDELDDPREAEVLIWEGLGLTELVIAPHVDFGERRRRAADMCKANGFPVRRLTDAQALGRDGTTVQLLEP